MKDPEYYEQHKDDLEEWGERDLLVAVRFSAEEAKQISLVASWAGITVSTFVRDVTLKFMKGELAEANMPLGS